MKGACVNSYCYYNFCRMDKRNWLPSILRVFGGGGWVKWWNWGGAHKFGYNDPAIWFGWLRWRRSSFLCLRLLLPSSSPITKKLVFFRIFLKVWTVTHLIIFTFSSIFSYLQFEIEIWGNEKKIEKKNRNRLA